MSTFRQKVQATTNWVQPDPEDLVEQPKKARFAIGRRAARPDAGTSATQPRAAGHGRRRGTAAPIAAHRLFPAFATLWFAALFGLGSLAISSEALGALVTMIGLPALVPAAAPPLGFTAHVLVAFAMTVAGALVGLVVALRLRAPGRAAIRPAAVVTPPAEPEADEVYKVRARDAHPDAPPRRPLVLTEAFADPLDDAPAAQPIEPDAPLLRRKPAKTQDELAPSGPWIPEFAPGGSTAVQPLDLSALDLIDPLPTPDAEPQVFGLAPSGEDLGEHEPAPMAEEAPIAEEAIEADPAPALPSASFAETAPVPAAPALIAATPQLPVGFAAAMPEAGEGGWSPVAGVPLESLGLVQLIERLALGIASRKAAAEGDPAADAAHPGGTSAQQVGRAGDPAETEFAPGPFSMPASLLDPATSSAPSATDPLAGGESAGSARSAILRRLGALAAGEPRSEATSVARFSRPAESPAASPAAEPVVPLPLPEASANPAAGPAVPQAEAGASVPFEADEALRSALATLQRMTARG